MTNATSSLPIKVAALSFALAAMAACSNGVALGPSDAATAPATSTTAPAPTVPAAPTTPTPPAPPPATPAPPAAAVAYTPDLQPIFDSDCVPCHGTRSPKARYSMTTYGGVMAAVRTGSVSSALVIVTQPGGVMYTFLSGDRVAKANMIKTWVLNGAPQSR